jgi:uncharacterized protein HemY
MARAADGGRCHCGYRDRTAADKPPTAGASSLLYVSLGEARFWQDRWDEAAAAFEQSLTLADQTGQEGLLAIARARSASLFAFRGEVARCISDSRLALTHAQSVGSGPTETLRIARSWAGPPAGDEARP